MCSAGFCVCVLCFVQSQPPRIVAALVQVDIVVARDNVHGVFRPELLVSSLCFAMSQRWCFILCLFVCLKPYDARCFFVRFPIVHDVYLFGAIRCAMLLCTGPKRCTKIYAQCFSIRCQIGARCSSLRVILICTASPEEMRAPNTREHAATDGSPFCRLVLRGAYTATLYTALLNQIRCREGGGDAGGSNIGDLSLAHFASERFEDHLTRD